MNQGVGLNALVQIYFDTDCDCLPFTLCKQRYRFKIRLLNYNRDQIVALETTSNSSAVVINSASVKKSNYNRKPQRTNNKSWHIY